MVAVFALRDSTGRLNDIDRVQLADYLAVKLVEAGAYFVVPRSQLEAVLRTQKKASYRSCYDEACQIEVGKELAASHSLVTQVLQVGAICAVASTLYDLRLQATSFAATQKGGCDPEDLAESIERVSVTLTRHRQQQRALVAREDRTPPSRNSRASSSVPGATAAHPSTPSAGLGAPAISGGPVAAPPPPLGPSAAVPTAPPPPTSPAAAPPPPLGPSAAVPTAPPPPTSLGLASPGDTTTGPAALSTPIASDSQYTLRVAASPSSALILLDGREQGQGPIRRRAQAGAHTVTVEKRGYRKQTVDLSLDRDRRLEIELQMDPAHRRERTEWFGMSTGAYTNGGSASGGLLSARLFTLRWRGPFWTLLEGTIGASSGESRRVCAAPTSGDGTGVCTDGKAGVMGALQTVFGWSFSVDKAHRHQFEILSGVGPFGYSAGAEGAGPLAVSPGLRYLYHGDHGFSVGFSLRSFISVLGRDCADFGDDYFSPVSEQLECDTGRQALFAVDIPFGWSY